jgi:hypothetical protein
VKNEKRKQEEAKIEQEPFSNEKDRVRVKARF